MGLEGRLLEIPGGQGSSGGVRLGAAGVVKLHVLVGSRAGVAKQVRTDRDRAGVEAVTPDGKIAVSFTTQDCGLWGEARNSFRTSKFIKP